LVRRLKDGRIPNAPWAGQGPFQGYTRGGTWGDQGTILLSHLDRLYAVPATGGQRHLVEVTGMKPGKYEYPQFLPGGEDFLFLFHPDDEEGGEVYMATLSSGKAVDPTPLMKNDTAASYTPTGGGRILFVRDDRLYGQKLVATAGSSPETPKCFSRLWPRCRALE
jgi:hypothetical protein